MSVEWKISDTLISYTDAIRFMEDRVESIINGEKAELIWLLEHPPIYTSGTSSEKKIFLTNLIYQFLRQKEEDNILFMAQVKELCM